MAIPGGYRFTIPFDDVFPERCYVMNVVRAEDYNTGKVSYTLWAKAMRQRCPSKPAVGSRRPSQRPERNGVS